MNYDEWKQETPPSPDYYCIVCGVEISGGRVCGRKDCTEEYEGYEYLKSKE